MTNQVDLHIYQNFVEAITSAASNNTEAFIARLTELSEQHNINPALLNTVGIGLSSEAGEFGDIVKKLLFHGKEFNEELRQKLKSELGDVIWYWINACRALNLDPNEVITANVSKLEARHPDGKFNVSFEKQRETQGD